MHCNQPLYGNSYIYGPYTNFIPPTLCGGFYPEIVGEGDVTTVTLPDGTVQFLFSPAVNWWAPYQCHPSGGNINFNGSYVNTSKGAWLIRSITNPVPAPYSFPSPRPCLPKPFHMSDCNISALNNGFQLKFHNDSCTSTTDIHYFYPNLYRYRFGSCPLMVCEAVQVETPVADNTPYRSYVCDKPCHCGAKPSTETGESGDSRMSITEDRSQVNCKCATRKDFKKGKRKRTCAFRDTKNLSKNKSKVICECHESIKKGAVDKSVITYADTASECAAKSGRETQTCYEKTAPAAVNKKEEIRNSGIKTEQWCPITPTSEQVTEDESLTKILRIISSCSSGCSCRHDSD